MRPFASPTHLYRGRGTVLDPWSAVSGIASGHGDGVRRGGMRCLRETRMESAIEWAGEPNQAAKCRARLGRKQIMTRVVYLRQQLCPGSKVEVGPTRKGRGALEFMFNLLQLLLTLSGTCYSILLSAQRISMTSTWSPSSWRDKPIAQVRRAVACLLQLQSHS